jgi:hypothetical protein
MKSAPRFQQAGSGVDAATLIDWQLEVLDGVPESKSFAKQLAGVRDKLQGGGTRAACQQLRAYLHHVKHEGGRRLESLLVDSMLGVGDAIAEDLECRRRSHKHDRDDDRQAADNRHDRGRD